METYLSKRDLDYIVQQLRLALRKDMRTILRENRQPELVDTNEAARILDITPGHLRHIANKYPHIKKGETQQAQLLFVREALVPAYKDDE